MWRWRSALHRPGLRLAAVSAASAAVLAPGFPLMTGAIAPDHRPLLPSTRVSVPAYWTAMASYLNRSAPPGNLLVLPEDDFYQMPYTWGYYGADGFITDLITRNVVDPVAQGYSPAQQELIGAVRLVQQGLLAHDWPSVQRTLAAIGTPLLLVRGDVNAAFPGRHITPPAALEKALSEDKDMRLVRRFGKLELFALRERISPAGPVTSYATVNSAAPDLRDLALFPLWDRADIKPDAAGRSRGAAGSACFTMAARRRRTRDLYRRAARLAVPDQAAVSHRRVRAAGCLLSRPSSHSHHSKSSSVHTHTPPSDPSAPAHYPRPPSRWPGGRRAQLQVGQFLAHRRRLRVWPVGRSGQLCGVSRDGSDGTAGCACPTRTGPAGLPALALSAHADSACEVRSLAWRSGPLFVSLWVRNVSGAAPRMCLWETPIDKCAAMSPLPPNSASSQWYRYQAIVTPDPGTRSLQLFLYADVYTPGTPTTNEYSDVVVRRSPVALQPVVVATPRGHERPAPALYTVGESFSPDWIGPPGDQRVEVDGLRNGWLGPHSRNDALRFGPSSWYLLSRVASLLAAGLVLGLRSPFGPEVRTD